MGFELFVQWYQDGTPARIPYNAVYAAFGSAALGRDRFGFGVRYGTENESFVYAKPDPDGTISDIMIERPCEEVALWDAIVAVMHLGHAVCLWPGDACAIVDNEALEHLPADLRADLPRLSEVRDGAALSQAVTTS